MYIVFCRNTECIWIFYSDLLAEKSPMSLNLGSKSMFRLLWWCRTSDWCDVCVRLHITRVLTFDAVVTIFRGCLWAISYHQGWTFPQIPHIHSQRVHSVKWHCCGCLLASCKENSTMCPFHYQRRSGHWLTASLKGLAELNSSWKSYRFSKT